MNKPTLCGSNNINIPESGCGDCEGLEWQIEQIQDWIEQFEEDGYNSLANKPTINGVTVEGDKTSEDYLITALTAEEIEELTPIECYVPACQDSRACFGEACCMIVGCNTSTDSEVCVGGVCYMEVACDEPEPPTPEPTSSMSASIDVEEQETYAEGDEINIIYSIINDGETDIENVVITTVPVTETETAEVLEVGTVLEIETTYTITNADLVAGYVTFSISAVGSVDGESVTANATVTLNLTGEPTPIGVFDLTIEATQGETSEVGDTIQVSYTVANIGNAPITDITLTALKTSNIYTLASLAENGQQEYVAYYTLTAEDVAEGSVDFTLSASGTSAGETISDGITETIELLDDESE